MQLTSHATLHNRSHLYRILTALLVLLGIAAAMALPRPVTVQASGSGGLYYRSGYTVENAYAGSWLCYGWSSGAYHCTQHWYRASSGQLVSTNPAWVPNYGGTGNAGGTATGLPVSFPVPTSGGSSGVSATPPGISQWAYTGRASFPEPFGTYQGNWWGWCTSGAAWLARFNVSGLGNAVDWAWKAAARGQPTGSMPRVGAVAVFQPGVQGASSGGHVSYVAAVYASGWFLSEDVNFYWNGGGFGRVSFRYAHSGWGVAFIYA